MTPYAPDGTGRHLLDKNNKRVLMEINSSDIAVGQRVEVSGFRDKEDYYTYPATKIEAEEIFVYALDADNRTLDIVAEGLSTYSWLERLVEAISSNNSTSIATSTKVLENAPKIDIEMISIENFENLKNTSNIDFSIESIEYKTTEVNWNKRKTQIAPPMQNVDEKLILEACLPMILS